MSCEECHWYHAEKLARPFSNGKIFPCSNVLSEGWDVWTAEQRPPEACAGYCKAGEYTPTGAWNALGGMVRALEAMQKQEKETEHMDFMVTKEPIPGFPPEMTVTRQYVKLSGEWVEVYKTADCFRHLITEDKTRHFCVGYNKAIHELPPPTCSFLCGHICDEMKRQARAALEAHGQYFTEDERRHFQEYLAKENTVEWDDGYTDQQGGGNNAAD